MDLSYLRVLYIRASVYARTHVYTYIYISIILQYSTYVYLYTNTYRYVHIWLCSAPYSIQHRQVNQLCHSRRLRCPHLKIFGHPQCLTQDSVTKAALPQSLWFSHISAPITTGFTKPLPPTAVLAWQQEELWVKVEIVQNASGWAWEHASRCQVKFRGQQLHHAGSTVEEFCITPFGMTVGQAGSCCVLVSVLDLPPHGPAFSAAARVGDESLWSAWSDFGDLLQMLQPEVWSTDGCVIASSPLNRKMVLEWTPLCCALGAVPVECFATAVEVNTASREEVLLATSTYTARVDIIERGRHHLEVALHGFRPGMTYQFLLYAEAALPRLQGRNVQVAQSEHFHWPDVSEEWSSLVDWALPRPQPLDCRLMGGQVRLARGGMLCNCCLQVWHKS